MAVPGYVIKNKRTTLERAEKFISERYFTDINLVNRVYSDSSNVISLLHYAAPGRITFNEAKVGEYKEAQVGDKFGPTWSTHWFRVELKIPEEWKGQEVHFLWNSGSEAMLWEHGEPRQGLTDENKRNSYILSKSAKGNESKRVLYIEMACNELFGAGDGSQIAPPALDRYFTLKKCEIAIFDKDIYSLICDVGILHGMAAHLDNQRGYEALYKVNEIINGIDFDDRNTLISMHQKAIEFLERGNGETQHVICAIGHCHIDSAWLWSYPETIRKCARSWSATVTLMDEYPDFKFACSQACQFDWVKQHYPSLYERIKSFIKQGRFIPVGGAWTEMDGNMPGLEACCRQFLYGQRFFKKEFGITCQEFWLPDTFGYSGQLPQVMRQSGVEFFLTQKLSWNIVNKFPHHTFFWHGIDGSEVLAHFPPGDSYNMQGDVKELVYSMNNFQDKGRSNRSMYLFGDGDGGQGPTQRMIENIHRLKNCDGLPRMEMKSPADFFNEVKNKESENLCHWHGELFFEQHNATYTSQALTKKMNRYCEFLLHDVEVVCTLASLTKQFQYPQQDLEKIWKMVLLNQFHDVLPGSSIEEVYVDSLKLYKEVCTIGDKLLNDGVKALTSSEGTTSTFVMNTLSWERCGVVNIASDVEKSPARKKSRSNKMEASEKLAFARVPSIGYAKVLPSGNIPNPVKLEKLNDGKFALGNGLVRAIVNKDGSIEELYMKNNSRNAVANNCVVNKFVMFDDIPLYWDAWDVMDYHLETRKGLNQSNGQVFENGVLRSSLKFTSKISAKSSLEQIISLDADCPYIKMKTKVDWHESHKFLKVEFPLDVHSNKATYEIQGGHLQRPTRFNTSWDWAQYEVCGHKWADLSEYNFGVAVLNDSKYGWSCINNVLRLSLLRSPKAPDRNADMGTHEFTYAIMPHEGCFQEAGVIQAAYDLNCPLLVQEANMQADISQHSFITVNNPAVIIESIKKAEEHTNAIILRLYEAFGGQANARIEFNMEVKRAFRCNMLEDCYEGELTLESNSIQLKLKPFQIMSLFLIV